MKAKVNYKVDQNNVVVSIIQIPFNESLPHCEVDLSKLVMHKSKIVNNQLVNDFNLEQYLIEKYGGRYHGKNCVR